MKPLLRHTLRSAADSKAQVFIIILTVAVVTAMVFASFSISDIFYNLNMTENDRVAQGADMLLGSNGSAGELFSRARVDSVLGKNPDEIVRAEYFLKFTTVMKTGSGTKTVLLEATDLNDYIAAHNLKYVDFRENKSGVIPVIVGYTFAQNANLKAGDYVEVYIPSFDRYVKMYVMYIAADEGIFKSAANINILADFSAVGDYGMVSAVYITFKDPSLFTRYEEAFGEVLPAVSCSEGNNYSDVKEIVFSNTLLFAIGLVFIVATMGMILLTSYMIIARKRTREMVVFKAAGASPAMTALIMLFEVALYAIAGSAIGLALGRFGMQLTVNSMIPHARDLITYGFWKFAVSLIISVVVTIAASLAPVIAVSKKTIRELNSDSPRNAKAPKPVPFAIVTVVAAGSLAATTFLSGIWVALLSIIDIALIIVWISLAAPIVLKGVTALLRKIKPSGGFGLGTLTPNRNKAMRTITTLSAVIVAFSFVVVQIVGLVKYAVTPFTSRYRADAVISVASNVSDEQRFKLINSLYADGIEEVGFMTSVDFVLPKGRMDLTSAEKYFTLYGVDSYWMLEHCAPNLGEGTKERWEKAQNPLVLSEDMMIRFGYSVGDTVTYYPEPDQHKDDAITFTIVGVDYTITRYDRVGYVKYDALKDMAGWLDIFADFKEGADGSAALLGLIKAVEAQNLERSFVLTFEEWTDAESTGLQGILGILGIIQYAMIAVGIIGLINVSVVTVYDRKSEFRLYRLSGLSQNGYLAFAASEGLAMSAAGAVIGFAVCTAFTALLPVFVGIVDKYLYFPPVTALSAYITLAGSLVFALCWAAIAAARRRGQAVAYNERFLT